VLHISCPAPSLPLHDAALPQTVMPDAAGRHYAEEVVADLATQEEGSETHSGEDTAPAAPLLVRNLHCFASANVIDSHGWLVASG